MSRQGESRKTFGIVMVIVALLLVACGGGDGDTEPTATTQTDAAVPTLPSNDATASATGEISEDDLTVVTPNVPENTGTPRAAGTPESTDATIVASPAPSGTAPVSTPAVPGTGEVAAPTTPPATSTDGTAATPSSGTFETAGDGTGGSGHPGERSTNTNQPVASPSASPVAGIEVSGCDVTSVPAFTGTSTSYVTNAEVFFRQGPGTDCPSVYEAPLSEGQAVEVTGGPVTQAADGTTWIQVEVDGVPGWVSFDFVEPAG